MWENSLQSTLSMVSAMSKSVHVTPRRKAFRDMAAILCLSSAVTLAQHIVKRAPN